LANPSRVVQLLRQRPLGWFEGNVIEEIDDLYPGRGRRVYPRTQQFTTFSSYTLRHLAEGRELFWKLLVDDGEDPIRHPFMSLCWPLMDVPAELFLDTVSKVYQRASLAAGKLHVAGRSVDPGRIERAGLATIEGEEDDIAAPGQTNAAHGLCPHVPGNLRRRLLLPGSGHFSLFHGEKARKVVVPAIVELVEAATRSFARRPGGRRRSRRSQCPSDGRIGGGTAPAGDRAGDATTAAKMARGRAKPAV
jgi:poly(3-hydroxybutyrate) depolymerase